jgi:hypothetical protein
MSGVLDGVRVIEQGTFITGPAAGMILGDLGADVIKVEQPESGDPFRAFKGGLYSPHFQTYNRNKRSIALNPKNADDLAVFDDLIRLPSGRGGTPRGGRGAIACAEPATDLLRHQWLRADRPGCTTAEL